MSSEDYLDQSNLSNSINYTELSYEKLDEFMYKNKRYNIII